MNTSALGNEKEVWDTFPESEYERVLAYCAKTYGPPRVERRLSLQVTDFHRRDLDTRIRITDGVPILMQKGGDWSAEVRKESVVELPKDAQFIVSLYGMLGKMLNSDNIQRTIIKVENALFVTGDVEIKLTKHLGKEELYSYEVEELGGVGVLERTLDELGLTPDLAYRDDIYWKGFNRRANLDAGVFAEEELRSLITESLEV